jgi:hypothetical protein
MVDSKFTFAEAKALERVTGHTFQQISGDEEVRGSIDVVQALLWVSMKRVKPETKFSDLDELAIDDIEWIVDEAAAGEPDPTPPAEVAGEPLNN